MCVPFETKHLLRLRHIALYPNSKSYFRNQKIIFGAFGLPFGLIMTLVTGGELFTGNTALVTAAAMEGKTTKADLIKNWVASYAGNFVGSLILAFLAFKSGTLGAAPASKDFV